jgi:hypothetical protein
VDLWSSKKWWLAIATKSKPWDDQCRLGTYMFIGVPQWAPATIRPRSTSIYRWHCPLAFYLKDDIGIRLKVRKGVGAQTRWRLQKRSKGPRPPYPATYTVDELK